MNHNRLAPLGVPSIRSSISLSLSINSSKELIVSEEGWVVRVFFVYVGSCSISVTRIAIICKYGWMAIGRVVLAPSERRELERRARSRTLEAEDCQRAKLILLLAKGYSFSQICRRLDCTDR